MKSAAATAASLPASLFRLETCDVRRHVAGELCQLIDVAPCRGDSLLAQMQSTSTYLAQQLANLPKISRD